MPLDSLFSALIQSYDIFKKYKIPVDAILRAFLSECEKNAGVLRLVDLQTEGRDSDHQDPALLDVASRLEASVLGLILNGSDLGEKVTERLRTVRFVLPDDANTAIDTGIVTESLPIEDGVRRLAVAVGSVKVAAELLRSDSERSERSVRLRNIRMRQRLQNLLVAYTNIASALRDR